MDNTEMLKLYGEVPMQFTSYYKFSFTYMGMTADGKELMAFVGGGADDIYKMDVNTDSVPLKYLFPYMVYLDGKELWSDMGW